MRRNEINKQMASESLYIPKISKHSKKIATPKRNKNLSINNALYQDAQIRRERQKSERKRSLSNEKAKLKKQSNGILKSSQKMLIKRYLLEFDQISEKLGVGDDPESPIHYTQFIMLMQQLSFISEESESDMEKLKLIWAVIQNQDSQEESGHYCRKHSLKVICGAICGFNSKWMFKDYTQGQDVDTQAIKKGVIDLYADENAQVKLGIG
jgi:hypothetical protein